MVMLTSLSGYDCLMITTHLKHLRNDNDDGNIKIFYIRIEDPYRTLID